MKRGLYIILLFVVIVCISGCVTARKVTRDRVDQDLSGNQGYLQGKSSAPGQKDRPTTREYIDVQVEFPTWGEVKSRYTTVDMSSQAQKEAVGNQGYVSKKGGMEEDLPPVRKKPPKPVVKSALQAAPKIGEDVAVVAPAVATTYTVLTGDTLGKISRRFYGMASKWPAIYEANADKIKDPNRLRVGTVLTIPPLEDVESEYIK